MKHTAVLAFCAAFAAITCLSISVRAAGDDDDEVISEAMKTYHKAPKGTDPVAKKAANGEASDAEVKELLVAYVAMAKVEPPKGDADAWDKRMAALVAATQDLEAGKDGSVEGFKEAGNCKACHTDHKPDTE